MLKDETNNKYKKVPTWSVLCLFDTLEKLHYKLHNNVCCWFYLHSHFRGYSSEMFVFYVFYILSYSHSLWSGSWQFWKDSLPSLQACISITAGQVPLICKCFLLQYQMMLSCLFMVMPSSPVPSTVSQCLCPAGASSCTPGQIRESLRGCDYITVQWKDPFNVSVRKTVYMITVHFNHS